MNRKTILSLAIFASLSIATTRTYCADPAADAAVANRAQQIALRQARSVHLFYAPLAKDADAARVSINVTEVQTNSYYMMLGWDNGYCGLQDIHGQRAFIFSVWEPGDPFDFSAKEKDVPEEQRAKVLYAAPNVIITRFQHEGTGAKTIAGLNWEAGERITVKVEAKRDGEDRIAYSCYLRLVPSAEWLHFATISTLANDFRGALISNIYSFIEDFWRNGQSATVSRRAEYSQIATRSAETGLWMNAYAARFSADTTDSRAIDAGLAGDNAFFLATGGKTINDHAAVGDIIYLKNR